MVATLCKCPLKPGEGDWLPCGWICRLLWAAPHGCWELLTGATSQPCFVFFISSLAAPPLGGGGGTAAARSSSFQSSLLPITPRLLLGSASVCSFHLYFGSGYRMRGFYHKSAFLTGHFASGHLLFPHTFPRMGAVVPRMASLTTPVYVWPKALWWHPKALGMTCRCLSVAHRAQPRAGNAYLSGSTPPTRHIPLHPTADGQRVSTTSSFPSMLS